ncbi:MAG: hypothetical protein JSR39_07245 [Verrucomicrobia bacterium]|nr:hypothetical protein [Verrucomicrobiota bacterium]
MSMTVQEAGTCSTIFQTISDTAFSAADWVGKTVQTIGSTVADYAQKAAEYAKPHFDKLKDFVSENRGPIIIAAVAAAVGAIGYALISSVFCSRATPAQTQQAAPTNTATATRV